MKTKIIGLCSANIERSASFDTAVNYELREQKNKVLEVSSAGLNVEKILASTSPLRIQVKILNAGLHYGLVRDEIKEQVEAVVSRGFEQEHTDEIRGLYAQVRPLVHGYNLALRNQAFAEEGITDFPTPYGVFDPSKNFNLVLPMAEKDISKVVAKYETTGIQQPTTMTYGELVGVEQLVDNVSGGLEGARHKVQYFMDTRKKAVEKMMKYVK